MSSTVLVYGSGECEQLGLEFEEDYPYDREKKKATKLTIFDMSTDLNRIAVVKIICGGLHSLAFTN